MLVGGLPLISYLVSTFTRFNFSIFSRFTQGLSWRGAINTPYGCIQLWNRYFDIRRVGLAAENLLRSLMLSASSRRRILVRWIRFIAALGESWTIRWRRKQHAKPLQAVVAAISSVLALSPDQKLLLGLLVALVVVNFVYPLFALVSAIYRFGIVVGDICCLTGLCDGISLFVDQSY